MTLGFPVRGKDAKSVIKFPTDDQWRDWQVELAPSVNDDTGTISTQWEKAARNLYRKIKVKETGGDEVESEDIEAVIIRLSFCSAVSTDMNANSITVELALFNEDPTHPTHFLTTHVLRMPNERELREYSKNKQSENIRRGRRRVITHPEVTAEFYNTLRMDQSGYDSISDISMLHKMQVMLALEEAVAEFDQKEQVEIDFI